MHFVLQTPSLQHISLIKIVAALWNQRDIFIQIEQLSTPLPPDEADRCEQVWKKWMVIEKNVKSNVSTLPLPQLCKQLLLHFIDPLGMEIIYWCHYRSDSDDGYEFLDIVLPQQLCWTMHGTIDYGKTAKFMIKEERVDVERRYELACINCLEEEARVLFNSMGEERRREYIDGLMNRGNRSMHQYLLVYFTCTLSGDVDQLNSYLVLMGPWRARDINECLFQCSLLSGDGSTCEYWFEKLNQAKKAQVLDEKRMQRMSCDQSHTSNLLYYLSRMNEEQREGLFRKCTYDVLTCLLRWPLQSLFMEAVKFAWRFVNKKIFMQVLDSITHHIGSGFQKDSDIYLPLFWEFWRLGPARLKQHFLDNSIQFEQFLASNGEEFIRSIVDETLSHQIEELVYDRTGRISEVFMKESAISEAALIQWKETAALNSKNDPLDVEKRLKSERLSRFVDLVMQGRSDRRRNGGIVWKIVYSP